MEDIFMVSVVAILFIALPWLILHYITQWKRAGSLSIEDEKLLDELHETARRLDERLRSIERIMAADDPVSGIAPVITPEEWRTGTIR